MSSALPSVAAVSYLNTVPLIWGMVYGPQRGLFQVNFCLPSECALRLETGIADLGIVPVVEMHRQGLVAVPGTGIACDGPVRSILVVSRVEPRHIRTLATDTGSRTSAVLARIILRQRYGADPVLMPMAPDLARMLETADAALLIGDAALRHDPEELPYHVLDLGQEWRELTGQPMVFALWAGRAERVEPLLSRGIEAAFRGSLQYGASSINAIVEAESRTRGFSPELVRRYLTRHIVYEIGRRETDGLQAFLHAAAEAEALVRSC